MSELLDALINQRKQEAIDYKVYLEKIVALTKRVSRPDSERYPLAINSPVRRALYDNLKHVSGLEDLMRVPGKVAEPPADVAETAALAVDDSVRKVRKADWRGNPIQGARSPQTPSRRCFRTIRWPTGSSRS